MSLASFGADSDDCFLFPESIESHYTDLFKIDFTQPIRITPNISISVPSDEDLDSSLASITTLSHLYDLFRHTTNVPFQLTTLDSSIPCADPNLSYTTELLNMVGNPTQFAAHLRSTLLLSIAARNFGRSTDPNSISAETRQALAKIWSTILSRLLMHFNIICERYNIAECGSFNLSDLLHHFFNQIPSSVINQNRYVFPFRFKKSNKKTKNHSTTNNSIFSPIKSKIALSHFNNKEQIFLFSTLQTAFSASSMYSTARGGITFPLAIPSDQADTFTQHYSQLLDMPTPSSTSPPASTSTSMKDNISLNNVPVSRIPFSVFAYLGLINSIMVDIWSKFTCIMSFDHDLSVIKLFLSSIYLPDDLWSQTLVFISTLAYINLHLTNTLCEEINLIQIMNIKLHSIIHFPICTNDPLNSFKTYFSHSTFNVMLQTIHSILSHDEFKSSHFYHSFNLHQSCTYFALRIIYIYLIMQWASTSTNWLTCSHTAIFTFEDCLELFRNVLFHSQRRKPTIINLSSTEINSMGPPYLSPHLFCLVASLIIRFRRNSQPFLACIAQFLLDNPRFASRLYSHPQFFHLTSYVPLSDDTFGLDAYYHKMRYSHLYEVLETSLFVPRLTSTPFLQFFNLQQALKYHLQQIYKESSNLVFNDVIRTKIPTHTTSSAIIEGALKNNLLEHYDSSSSQRSPFFNQQKLLNDELSQTLTSISTQILSDTLYLITPVNDLAIGLQVCSEKSSQGGTISHADVFFCPSTLLAVNPIINVIPYMAVHHNFNKMLYHSIVCYPWTFGRFTSFSLFTWILGYLELYHTFLCKPVILSTIEEIAETSGPLWEISFDTSFPPDINAISEQVFPWLGNINNNNNHLPQSQSRSLSCTRIKDANFGITNLSQHSQFCLSLHKHTHLPSNVILPLYYSYTEALLSVIMGFSYTQFHLHENNNPIEPLHFHKSHNPIESLLDQFLLHKDNNPIEPLLDPSTSQSPGKINLNNDRCFEQDSFNWPQFLSHGTIFQISEEICQQKKEKCDLFGEKCDSNNENPWTFTDFSNPFTNSTPNKPKHFNDRYSEHALNLYNHPHQLTQAYVSPHRESGRAPKPHDKQIQELPLTLEWSSAMVQHSIELFIDLLLNECSYEFISQIDFSDGNPLAQQSTATLNYFDEYMPVALCQVITQHESSRYNLPFPHEFTQHVFPPPPRSILGNLPYFYNLTEQQQITLHETYSYDTLFLARYGPFDDVPLVHSGEIPEFSQADLSHALTDVNITIPFWLEQLLVRFHNEMASESTQDDGLRFHSDF